MQDYVINNDLEGAVSRLNTTTPRWYEKWFEVCKEIYNASKKWAKLYVLDPIAKTIKKLKTDGVKTVPISINVSRAHFYGNELKHRLLNLIEKYDLETRDIELEITESICGDAPDAIYELIRELQDLGFKIAMDDFGSGYSSLNMLKEMPLDILKMDLKFLDGEQEKGRKILKALIDMAHTLNLKVVVEGVETKVQVEFLKDIGSYYAQGYYFSKPVEIAVYESMLKENREM